MKLEIVIPAPAAVDEADEEADDGAVDAAGEVALLLEPLPHPARKRAAVIAAASRSEKVMTMRTVRTRLGFIRA